MKNTSNQACKPQQKPKKLLILGIGNIMFGDEGIGVHFVNYLSHRYEFTHTTCSIEFVDGGTLAHHLTPLIASADEVLIIDTINADDAQIGDVFFFDFDEVPTSVKFQGSAHEAEMLQTLHSMDLVGDRPKTHILGIVPKVIDITTMRLSDEILASLHVMEEAFLKHIKTRGFTHSAKSKVDIQALAYQIYKKGVNE